MAKLVSAPVKPSVLAQNLLYLEGKPLRFEGLDFMPFLIDCNAERSMFMTGRQVGKSTILGSKSISRMAAIPNHGILYVAPRMDQVAEFSKAKLNSMMRGSPMIQAHYVDSSVQQQARSKEFTNGSAIVLRSCYLSPDGIRGITANDIYIDEVQDIILENIPVIEECSSRKSYRSIIYTGTPKTYDNTIQKKWEESSQHYWAVKCTHCGHWNVPLGFDNIGDEYLQCKQCKKPLDARKGEYVGMFPSRKFVGFHVSQLMIAGVPGTGVPWDRIIDKRDDPLYGLAKFYNECLGFSYDVGSKLVTISDLIPLCDSNETVLTTERKPEWNITRVCAGIDWGVLGGNTRTVLTIGGLQPDGNIRILYAKKYPVDQDPTEQVTEICKYINDAGCFMVAADRGNGHVANSFLKKALPNVRIAEIEYKAKVSNGMQYNDKTRTWITDRTRAVAGIVIDIKRRKLIFPHRDLMGTFFDDLITLSCAYNDNLHAYQILRQGNAPDDFAHSLTYLRLAARFMVASPRATVHALEEFSPDAGITSLEAYKALQDVGFTVHS